MRTAKIVVSVCLMAMMVVTCKNRGNAKLANQLAEDWTLIIEHTGCRGNCPDYRITIHRDGKAEYFGNHAVEKMGNFEKKVSEEVLLKMNELLVDKSFWEYEDVYGGGVADLPSVVTTVVQDETTKRVQNIRNAPESLVSLQTQLEKLVGDEGWKKID